MFRLLIFRIHEYIKFWVTSKSTKGHGIHSPFLYPFIRSLRKRIPKADQRVLKGYRRILRNDTSFLEYRDHGAGSSMVTEGSVQLKKIYKSFSIVKKEGKLLYKITRWLQPDKVIEFGTSLGVSTCYLSLANNGATITYEGNKASFESARRFLKKHLQHKKIITRHALFDDALNELENELTENSLVFIDGNHSYEATLRYVTYLQSLPLPPKAIAISDIYWTPEMKQAWYEITTEPSNNYTINFFSLGLIINYISAPKQHFNIRY